MSIVIAITDCNDWRGRTDNIVVVNSFSKILVWIPRDLWSNVVQFRINAAFSYGGHELLIKAVKEIGFLVKNSICVWPFAIAKILNKLEIKVPVRNKMAFYYPRKPFEKGGGYELIYFNPPFEILSGERIHQWIGARFSAYKDKSFNDLDRIRRQRIFIQEMIKQKIDLSFNIDEGVSSSDLNKCIDEIRQIDDTWKTAMFNSFEKRKINGAFVLVKR